MWTTQKYCMSLFGQFTLYQNIQSRKIAWKVVYSCAFNYSILILTVSIHGSTVNYLPVSQNWNNKNFVMNCIFFLNANKKHASTLVLGFHTCSRLIIFPLPNYILYEARSESCVLGERGCRKISLSENHEWTKCI